MTLLIIALFVMAKVVGMTAGCVAANAYTATTYCNGYGMCTTYGQNQTCTTYCNGYGMCTTYCN